MFELWKKHLLNSTVQFSPPDEGNGAGGGDNGDQDAGSEGAGDAGAGAGSGDGSEGDDAGSEGDGDTGEDPYAGLTDEQKQRIRDQHQRDLEKEVGWRDRQIDRLHRQKRNAQEDNKTLTTIASRQAQSPPAAEENLTPTQVEERARQLAQTMTAQERYNQGLIDTDQAGRKAFDKDWKAATDKLGKLGGVSPEDMQSILATDHPEVVLFSLADPEEYERVMNLPPAKRNNAFVKIGLKEPPKKKADVEIREDLRPGGSSRPVRPLNGSNRNAAMQVDLHDDKIDDEKWYEERNRTRRKKFTDAQ